VIDSVISGVIAGVGTCVLRGAVRDACDVLVALTIPESVIRVTTVHD
jgi:hypothetical protein